MDRLRLLPMLLVLIATVLGLWAALVLIGWHLFVPVTGFDEMHGPLMVNGVLATLVGMERAVSLQRRTALAVPTVSAIGALSLLTPWGIGLGGLLWFVSGIGLIFLFLVIFRLQPTLHSGIMVLGASLLAAGNLYWWMSGTVAWMVLWWVSFLVLLITAERLELSRVLFLSRAKKGAFAAAAGLLLIAPAFSVYSFPMGVLVEGAGLALVGTWLLLYDIARRNLRTPGRSRFMAVALISGYAWLIMAAIVIAWGGAGLPGTFYDAFLHSIFLGFVFTMIMAHAMVILQSFLGREIPFSGLFYLPLILVESTLALRVYSDIAGSSTLRTWAGLLNVGSIALFGLLLVSNIARGEWMARVVPSG